MRITYITLILSVLTISLYAHPEISFSSQDYDTKTADVWYTFNSGTNAQLNLKLSSTAMSQFEIMVFDASLDTELFCGAGDKSLALTDLSPNTDYCVQVTKPVSENHFNINLRNAAAETNGDPVIYLDALPNYANQPVPNYINRDNTPPDNPITDLGATLGRVLFYDKNLSTNNTISCGSCHLQEFAFGDPAIASVGVNGTTGRHGMRLVNARFAAEMRFFWDERANTLEAQTTQPIQDHAEMGYSGQNGDPSFADLIVKLEAIDYYQTLFTAVYGDPTITEDRVQRAIAQFVRSIQSFDSRYDEGRAMAPNDGAPFMNFTGQENAGKNLFLAPPQFAPGGQRTGGGLGCAGCHQPPAFDIDPNSRNNGVVNAIGGGLDLLNTRSPTLRDMLQPDGTAHTPFMHNGALATLDVVINHYNMIPNVPGNNNLDNRLRPGGATQVLNITPQERGELTAFLNTLSGINVYTDPKWSDPFDENGNLIVLETNATEVLMETSGISIFVNPTSSDVHIVLESGSYTVKVLDENENEFQTLTVNNSLVYDLCQLPAGLFFLEIVDLNNPDNRLQRIIKAE